MSPILECKKLIKKYGEVVAVNELDFAVEPGCIVGLFGVEGSGKTTLLKLAAGLLTPSGGEVLVNGNKPGVATKRVTAFLPHEESFGDNASVIGALRFYRDFYADFDEEKALSLLSALGIELKDRISDLSKGSLQKLRLSLTLSRNATLYLLDSPVEAVDTATLSYILDSIVSAHTEKNSVIISSRTPSDVERIITHAAFVSAGRIVLFENAEKLRADKGKSIHAFYTEEYKC